MLNPAPRPPSRAPQPRQRTSRRASRRPAPAPRFLHRPVLGGEFGQSGRYLLATTPRVERGLHQVTHLVLDSQAGIVLAIADDKAQALGAARKAVRASMVAERCAALAAAAEAGQGELWPEHGLRPKPRRRPSRRRRQVWEASKGCCVYCRVPLDFETFEVEHMMPRALDGTDEGVNLAAACRACNRAKRDRTALEFVAGE